MNISPKIAISIVSHGQGSLIGNLLSDIRKLGIDPSCEVIVTLNVPEDESFLRNAAGLSLKVIRNVRRRGFGENHNTAASCTCAEIIAIVNPDVRLPDDFDWAPLLAPLSRSDIGVIAPVVLDPRGKLEDSARRKPTILRLARRILIARAPDYDVGDQFVYPDWVAAMFIVMSRQRFAELQGFDERYFMYMEDADLCRRARLKDWKTLLVPQTAVVHDARRDSHRKIRPLLWHLKSAARYFFVRPHL